jgi:4-hydroxybenzoate polyprenyltransferase
MTRLLEISFNFIMGKILFLISVATLFFLARMNFKEKLNAVIKNFRAERVFSYVLMIFFGIFIAHTIFPYIKLNWNDWLSVIVLCLSFIFSCLFAICANDMADEDTDKISNADRPLISNALSKQDMKQMGFVFLLASLISGFLAGYTAFFFVLTFTSLYYIYSVPPTRFKLIPFFSSFIISLCMLSAIIAGFFLVSPVKYVPVFPTKLILAIVVIFSLLANVRDMKDVKGDKMAGIKTVPIIFGNKWGPRVVAIFAGLAFILIPLFSGIYILFITAIPTALASWYYINKKPYSEKPLDKVYFAFMFASFLLLFI